MLPPINVVLVRSKYSGNVGSSARALANMGGSKLILVDPQTSINTKARQGAAGAQDKLQQRVVYPSMQEFYQKEAPGIHIALSARSGKKRQSLPLKDSLKHIIQFSDPVYFIFGPEDHGLTSDDMQFCHHVCHLPTFGDFTSLNLSQAVLLTLFSAQEFFSLNVKNPKLNLKTAPIPDDTLKQWIQLLGFNLDSPRVNAYTTLRDLILKSVPTEKEVQVLEATLQQTIRILKKQV